MGGCEIFRQYFVATFRLAYSKDGLTWEDYQENGEVKVSSINIIRTF